MDFERVFDSFSRRENEKPAPLMRDVPQSLRTKIMLLCRDVFSNSSRGDYSGEFWDEIHQIFCYRLGKVRLSSQPRQLPGRDILFYLQTCPPEEFLDFVEDIFTVKCLFHVDTGENALVRKINELFRSENAAYELTEMVKEKVIEKVTDHYFFHGREMTVIKTVAYPKVIRKDSQVMHTEAVGPALVLLQNPCFRNANEEFLKALEDFRKGDYNDCLTKCGSAFESIMKIICDEQGWGYNQNDTASTLVRTILDNTSLDNYFETLLIIVATLRNRLSSSHGQGTQQKPVPEHLARYALNATASAMLLLADESEVSRKIKTAATIGH